MTRPLPSNVLRAGAMHPLHLRELAPQDLYGLPYVSYLRISSKPQEKGTGIKRQQEVRDQIERHFQLVRDSEIEDKGFSASKNHHVLFGQLGVLLKMVTDGEITHARPTVLTIEATDRLFRSGQFEAFDVLKRLVVDGGMIVVTGDMSIWNYHSVNDSMKSVKLNVEISMARGYAKRLSEMALGSHAGKREMMEQLAVNPTAKKPRLAGRPPAWIVWDDSQKEHVLHPLHTETVRRIFELYGTGYSVNQIALRLKDEGTPILGDKPKANQQWQEWRPSKIADVLRDESVLGYVQPHKMVNGKREPVGGKAKVYPAAVDADAWLKAQEMLNARGLALRGRKGDIANLFTGKIHCGVCGGSMRVDTGGAVTKRRIRKFQCTRYVEGRHCTNALRYDVPRWEPLLLEYIIAHSALVPRQKVASVTATDLADLRVEMQNVQDAIAVIEPKIGKSPTMAERWERLCQQLDALREREQTLAIQAQAVQTGASRAQEIWRFLKELHYPALSGDRDARERLRGLLSKIDFDATFGTGLVELRVNDWRDSFEVEEIAGEPDWHC